jgi:hypothetical protein
VGKEDGADEQTSLGGVVVRRAGVRGRLGLAFPSGDGDRGGRGRVVARAVRAVLEAGCVG